MLRETRRTHYALAALVVFGVETVIALFVRDDFVRPYLGDVLAVGLVYLVLRAATPWRVLPAVAVALGIAFAVEFAQAFKLVDALGMGGHVVVRTVLGSAFDLKDMLAYTIGAAGVLALEAARKERML